MLRNRQLLPLGLLILGALACNTGTGTTGAGGSDGGGGQDGADGTAWISGAWTGTFELKTDEPQTTQAKATFELEDPGVGAFAIELPQREGVAVKGRFHDFAGTSLLLEVTESGISSLGVPGTSTNVDYDLIGDALKIYNDRALLRLVRDRRAGDDGDDDDGPNPQPSETALSGRWACPDGRGNVWQVFFETATTFSLDIYDDAGVRASIWMDGTVKTPEDTSRFDGMLTVTRAQVGKYEGEQLGAKRISPTKLILTRLGPTDVDMSCLPSA